MQQEIFESGNYYHIFNRGNNKENIFKEDENYIYSLQLIKKYLADICTIYAYCLLPNHFHILLRIKDNHELPGVFQHGKKKIHQPFSNLFNAYTKAINKKYDRTGSLFQEHLKRNKINSENYIKQLVLYIHLNPEKHEIINNFSAYTYSSYKAYLSSSPSLLQRQEILDYFKNKENFIQCHKQRKGKLQIAKEIEELDF